MVDMVMVWVWVWDEEGVGGGQIYRGGARSMVRAWGWLAHSMGLASLFVRCRTLATHSSTDESFQQPEPPPGWQ